MKSSALACECSLFVRSWQNHPESAAMWATLRYVRAAQPIGGCLENVLGLDLSSETETSALAVVVAELSQMGYATETVTINLNAFSTMVRARCHFKLSRAFHMPCCVPE
eukprot:6474619-Amphidinium_carterae.3